MVLLPTFRLPTLIHTRSGNAKYLNEISHRNPLWIHTSDAQRLGLATGDLVRVTTEIGYFVNHAWVTEAIAPGVVACSHHLGRWRLHEGEGSRWSSVRVALDRRRRRHGCCCGRSKGSRPFASADPDSRRIWWSDGGVHQNLTFPVHPDPVSGMHCWHQKVVVARAHVGRPLRRRVRGHEPIDGGLPRVAREDAARPGAGRPAAPAVARPPPASRGKDVRSRSRPQTIASRVMRLHLAGARVFISSERAVLPCPNSCAEEQRRRAQPNSLRRSEQGVWGARSQRPPA